MSAGNRPQRDRHTPINTQSSFIPSVAVHSLSMKLMLRRNRAPLRDTWMLLDTSALAVLRHKHTVCIENYEQEWM